MPTITKDTKATPPQGVAKPKDDDEAAMAALELEEAQKAARDGALSTKDGRLRREAKRQATEFARTPQPNAKLAVQVTSHPPVPPNGHRVHTGRWIPRDPISYVTVKGATVRAEPQLHTADGPVPNVLDDIPPGVAYDAFLRGVLEPEYA